MNARAIAALGATALLLGWLSGDAWSDRPKPPMALTIGGPLPSSSVSEVGSAAVGELHHYLTADSTCTLLTIISTTCGICQRMRGSWPAASRRWVDSVGAPIKLVWLGGEDHQTLLDFYSGFAFAGVRKLKVNEDPVGTFRRLGVIGTPTTYLLDGSGQLIQGIIGNRRPPVRLARDSC